MNYELGYELSPNSCQAILFVLPADSQASNPIAEINLTSLPTDFNLTRLGINMQRELDQVVLDQF